GEEAVARWAVLGEHFVAAVSVVPDGRGRHEDARLALAARHCGGKQRGALRAALQDATFLLDGPPTLADAFTREVNDRVDPFQRRRVDAARIRIPTDLVAAADPTACELQDPATVGPKRRGERRTQEAMR